MANRSDSGISLSASLEKSFSGFNAGSDMVVQRRGDKQEDADN